MSDGYGMDKLTAPEMAGMGIIRHAVRRADIAEAECVELQKRLDEIAEIADTLFKDSGIQPVLRIKQIAKGG